MPTRHGAWPEPSRPPLGPRRSVDVFVAAFHEPAHVVKATLLGCRAIAYPHETWLLDDANRAEMAALAEELGTHYVTRTSLGGARMGALQNALTESDGELFVLLDADQVPMPDLLHATAGYFADAGVAVVQTPHEYSNRDSLLHSEHTRHERSLHNEVVSPGREARGAAIWEGAAALVRREALVSIGGLDLDSTTTPDFHASIKLHAAGWTIHHHNEVLVQGLAPHNLDAFLTQRARWARGHLATLRTKENPLITKGLTRSQRLCYFADLWDFMSGLQRLALIAVLCSTLLSGNVPFEASLPQLVVIFGGWFALKATAEILLGRGRIRTREPTAKSLVTLEVNLAAVVAAAIGIKRRFRPVLRTGVDKGGFDVIERLKLLAILALMLEVAVILRMLDALIGWPLPPQDGLALIAMLVAGAYLLYFVLQVLGVFVRRKQFRQHYRVDVDLGGYANQKLIRIKDLTPAGIAIVTTVKHNLGDQLSLALRLADARGGVHDIFANAIVRSSLPNQTATRWRLGCEFLELGAEQQDAITEYVAVVRPFQLLRA